MTTTVPRFGYKNTALRVLSGGLLLLLGAWVLLGIIDRFGAFASHKIDVHTAASTAAHLSYTYSIGTDGNAYGAAWLLALLLVALSAAGVGRLAGSWVIGGIAAAIAGGGTVVLMLIGLMSGTILPNVAEQVQQRWTSQYYHTANALPDIDSVRSEDSKGYDHYTYYPTPFTLLDAANKPHYFLEEALLDNDENVLGANIHEVTHAQATAALKKYQAADAKADD